MPYASYQPALQPTAIQDPVGQAFMRAQGIVKDYLLERARQAVQMRFPTFASSDALGATGSERLIDRGEGPQLLSPESDGDYAARLIDAWNIWYWGGTAYGMLKALAVQGYTPSIVQQNGLRFNLDGSGNLVIVVGPPWRFPSPNLWNTFLVIFTTVPSSWIDIHNPPTSTSSPSDNELARIARIINLWRPAHMICAGLEVVTSGVVWGFPSSRKWGDGSVWGGTATTFPVPL